jgi:hypothetical protein
MTIVPLSDGLMRREQRVSELIEARSRRAPFFWASTASFRILIEEVPAAERAAVGWIYTCLTATASELFDGNHQGFVATKEAVQGLSGVSESTFKRSVRKLEALGLLLRQERKDDRGGTLPNRYVLLEPAADQTRGATDHPRVADGSPDDPPNARPGSQSKKKNPVPDGTGNALAKIVDKPVSYRGKPVKPEVVGRAEGALAVFNEMTGRGLGARTTDGHASAMLKQIIGTMLEWPDVTAEEWATAIRHTVENPPDWVDGKQMQIGHIFGARAVQHALSNDGCPSARSRMAAGQSVVERTQSKAERWARGEV